MYERIVVTLDGSELAEAALPCAEELMGRLGSKLILLHVCDPAEREQHERYFNLLAERIKRNAEQCHGVTDAKVETIVMDGKPAEEIIDYAENNDIDLTVMATHGRSGISRWAMGSIADKVLHGTTRPVVLIRAKGSHAEVCLDGLFRRILAPLDGSELGEAALPYIEELALKLNAEVVLLQALPRDACSEEVNWIELRELAQSEAKIYLRKVERDLASRGIAVRGDIKFGGRPTQQIIDSAVETGASIIAMSTHGRSGVDRLIFGSVAEKVLRAGDAPILLVRAPGARVE